MRVAWSLLGLLLCMALRADSPAEETGVTVTAVGDVRLTSELVQRHPHDLNRLELEGDLVFANFEGVLRDMPDPDPWKFCVPLRGLEVLKSIGFNVLSLANNHALDLGRAEYRRTRELLTQAGFLVADGEDSGVRLEVRGTSVRLIGFSFDTPNDVNDLANIPKALVAQEDEILIVSAHMGGENHLSHFICPGVEHFGNQPRGDVIAFSRGCVDAGADLVLGHGPHVPRGLELYKGKLIVYSLGNFLFDYPGCDLNTHCPGYALSVTLDARGDFRSARIHSYDLRNGVPVPDAKEAAYCLVREMTHGNLGSSSLDFPGEGRVERRGSR